MELVSLSVIATLVLLLIILGISYIYEHKTARLLIKILQQIDSDIDDLATEYCKLSNRLDAIASHLGLDINNSDNELENICFPYDCNNPLNTED